MMHTLCTVSVHTDDHNWPDQSEARGFVVFRAGAGSSESEAWGDMNQRITPLNSPQKKQIKNKNL